MMDKFQKVSLTDPVAFMNQSFNGSERDLQPIKGILKKRLMFNDVNTRQQHKTDVFEDDVKEPEESLNVYHQSQIELSSEFLKSQLSGNNSLNLIPSHLKANSAISIYQSNFLFDKDDDIQIDSVDKAGYYNDLCLERSHIRLSQEPEVIINDSPKRQFSDVPPTSNLVDAWRKKSFEIIYHVTKFSKQLKTRASLFRFRQITKKIISLIGDKAGDGDEIMHLRKLHNREVEELTEKKRSIFLMTVNSLLHRFQILIAQVPIIEPDGLLMMIWGTIVVILIIITMFFIPMKISFNFTSYNDGRTMVLFMQTIPTWFFVVDIFLNFNTAYYDKGMIHTRRKQIIQHYLRGNFGWDFIIMMSFIISNIHYSFLDFILLLKAMRLKSMVEHLEEVFDLKFKIQAVFDLTKSVLFIIYVSHFVACAWHYIGDIQYTIYGSKDCWLVNYNIQDDPWWSKYIFSLYFSIITTLTIGYGDITPKTNVERVFAIIVSLFVCGVFGFTISSIGEIFRNMMEKQQHFKAKMKFINQYLKSKKNIKKNLQVKIRKYFEYYFKNESNSNTEGERLIGLLTKKLRVELQDNLYTDILKKSRIIIQNLSAQQIRVLSSCVHEFTYGPEEEIYTQGDQASRLFYILNGDVVVFAYQYDGEAKETIIKKVHSGNFIGEPEFATEGVYNYSLRADKFTTIAYVNYEDFYRLLKENEESLHKYCQMKDNLLYNTNFKSFGQICEICEWTHQFTGCPFVFHQPNKSRIAKIFQTGEKQRRSVIFGRSARRTSNNFKEIASTQECALAYIINNDIMSQMDLTDDYLSSLGFKLEDETLSPQQSLKQGSIIPHTKTRPQPLISTSIMGEQELFTEESELQVVQKFDKPFNKYDMKQRDPIDVESNHSDSDNSQAIQNDKTLNTQLSRRTNRVFNTSIQKQTKEVIPYVHLHSLGQQRSPNAVKESLVTLPRKAVQFTLNPIFSSQNININKKEPPNQVIPLVRLSQNQIKYKQEDIQPQYASKQFSTRDLRLNHPMINSRHSGKKQSKLMHASQQRLSLLMNDFDNSYQRNTDQKNSQVTYKSQASNLLMAESQELEPIPHHVGEVDLRTNFQERIDFDIDRWLTNSQIYFPNFNLTSVMKSLQVQQEKNIQKMVKNKSRTTNPLNKFRSMTFKTTIINK